MISTCVSSKGFTPGRTCGTFSLRHHYFILLHINNILLLHISTHFWANIVIRIDSNYMMRRDETWTFCPQRNGSRQSRLLGDIASNRSCPNRSWSAENDGWVHGDSMGLTCTACLHVPTILMTHGTSHKAWQLGRRSLLRLYHFASYVLSDSYHSGPKLRLKYQT